jgi:hypothetical protein
MNIKFYIERMRVLGWERLEAGYDDLGEAKRIAEVIGECQRVETRIVRVIEEVVS